MKIEIHTLLLKLRHFENSGDNCVDRKKKNRIGDNQKFLDNFFFSSGSWTLVRARAIYLGAKTRHVIVKTNFGDGFNSSTLVDEGEMNI